MFKVHSADSVLTLVVPLPINHDDLLERIEKKIRMCGVPGAQVKDQVIYVKQDDGLLGGLSQRTIDAASFRGMPVSLILSDDPIEHDISSNRKRAGSLSILGNL